GTAHRNCRSAACDRMGIAVCVEPCVGVRRCGRGSRRRTDFPCGGRGNGRRRACLCALRRSAAARFACGSLGRPGRPDCFLGLRATRVLSGLSKWIAVSVLGVIGLHSSIGIVVSLALMASPDRTGFLTGHSVVTVLWAVVALVLLIRGLKQRPLRVAGLILV